MEKVIRCVGLAGESREPGRKVPVGEYLVSYDPMAHDGQGEAVWSALGLRAARFRDGAHALEFWRQVPPNRPLRADGKPNRPLTAFTVEIVDAP